MSTMKRATAPSFDDLWTEWRRIENATGRTDEQADADGDRIAEIEKEMAAIPAANIRQAACKLVAFADGFYGAENQHHPLIASAIADLNNLGSKGGPDCPILATLGQLVSDLETLQAKLDTYSAAAAIIADMMSDPESLGDCRLFYAAHHTLASLHRDVTDLVELAVTADRATDGGAA